MSYVINASFKKLNITASNNGVYVNNYNASTATFEDCIITAPTPVRMYQANATKAYELVFKGENTFTGTDAAWLKIDHKDDTITAKVTVKLGEDENLTFDGISYDKNYYGVTKDTVNEIYIFEKADPVAQIGETLYISIQAAIDDAENGDVIKVIKDHELDGSAVVAENTWGYDTLILFNEAKAITLDFNGHTVSVTPDFDSVDDGGLKGTIESIVFLGKGANLTVKDSSSEGSGGFLVKEGTDLYSLFYNSKSTLTVENGNYNVAETTISGAVIYADKVNTTSVEGGLFILGNASEDTNSTKPWIFNVEDKNSGNFVVVTGGTYNQDLLMNLGTSKDCEVEIPDTHTIVYNGVGENGLETWTVLPLDGVVAARYADNVCVKLYNDLSDALDEAKSGETVKLLADTTESFVAVTGGVTLDLNGYDLTAGYVAAFNGNEVVDNSEEKTGLLKVSKNCIGLSNNNSQMPVYVAEDVGYRFATIDLQAWLESGDETWFEIGYWPDFGSFGEYFADGSLDNDVKIALRFRWPDDASDTVNEQDVVFNEAMVGEVYASDDLCFFVAINDLSKDEYSNLEVIAVAISTSTNVEIASEVVYVYNPN